MKTALIISAFIGMFVIGSVILKALKVQMFKISPATKTKKDEEK